MGSRRHILVWGVGAWVLFLASAGVAWADADRAGVTRSAVIYVDDGAALGGDGLSWATAFKYLQDGLAAAGAGDEIRVAGGVYRADQDEGGNVTTGDRAATFQLISGVGLYGGYGGLSNPGNPDERDIVAYETTLTGDLQDNDDPADFPAGPTYDENSYHVVIGSGTDATAIIDGFMVSGGRANGSLLAERYGGGMDNDAGSPSVSNCTFTGNSAVSGGGMGNRPSSAPKVTRCTFTGNSAGSGGAMKNWSSNATVTDCLFTANWATFLDEAGFAGGAMSNGYSSPIVANCIFAGNVAVSSGGGAMANVHSSPTVSNCTFFGNSDVVGVGGMRSRWADSTPTVVNCVFWENAGLQIGDSASVTTVTHSDVQGGWGGTGHDNIDVDPLFVDPDGPDDIVGNEDDNLRLSAGSRCIDAGDNGAVTVTTDLDGRPRILDGNGDSTATVDMGAYEYLPLVLGDMNCDATLDPADITPFALALVDPAGYGQTYPGCDITRGDMNGDTFLDGPDIQAFVTELLAP